MEEKDLTGGIPAPQPEQPPVEPAPVIKPTEPVVPDKTTEKPAKTLTQEEVNAIVQKRLAESKESLYKKYGVKDDAEFDAFIGKAKTYGELETKYKEAQMKLEAFESRKLMFDNRFQPTRFDDVLAYIRGKNVPIDADSIKAAAESHPEWLRQPAKPVVQPMRMGNTGTTTPAKPSDAELARQLFPSLRK